MIRPECPRCLKSWHRKIEKSRVRLAKLFATHPESLERRDTSLQLVARFPEKEEYVISTSEFQRVKAHLLKLSNAKAGVVGDFDQTDDSKPTLKRAPAGQCPRSGRHGQQFRIFVVDSGQRSAKTEKARSTRSDPDADAIA